MCRNWQLCFRKSIIHNIQTRKMWYYFDSCFRVPFNRWEHSRGCQAHRTINFNHTRVLRQWQLTVSLPKMHYKQYPDSENVDLFLYMPPSTLQSVGAQPGQSGPSHNWFKWYKAPMAVGTDIYASENVLYPISRLGKYDIIFLHVSKYPSTGGSTAGAVGAIRQFI